MEESTRWTSCWSWTEKRSASRGTTRWTSGARRSDFCTNLLSIEWPEWHHRSCCHWLGSSSSLRLQENVWLLSCCLSMYSLCPDFTIFHYNSFISCYWMWLSELTVTASCSAMMYRFDFKWRSGFCCTYCKREQVCLSEAFSCDDVCKANLFVNKKLSWSRFTLGNGCCSS